MKNYKNIKRIVNCGVLLCLWILPQVVSAESVVDFIDAAFSIVTTILIPLAFALCLFYFFWGVTKYIRTGATSEDAAKEAKGVMVWGVVGIFVAFSIWGIIAFIKSELGVPDVQNIDRPSIEYVNSTITY